MRSCSSRVDCANIVQTKDKSIEKKNTDDYFHKIMHLPIILMKLFGVFHHKKDKMFMKVYCIFVLVILWFNFIRLFFNFKGKIELTGNFVYKITNILWYFRCASTQTVLFINRSCNSKEEKMIKQLNLLFEYHDNNHKQLKCLRKKINLIFIIFTFASFFEWILNFYSFFGSNFFTISVEILLAPFQNEKWAKESIPLKIFFSFCILFDVFTFSYGFGLFLADCMITLNLVQSFNKKFKEFIQTGVIVSDDSFLLHRDKQIGSSCLHENYFTEENFEYFRIWHLKLTVLVKKLNSLFHIILAFAFFISICVVFLITFLVSDWSNNCIHGIIQFLIPFWILNSLSEIIFGIILASYINENVRKIIR